MNKLTDRTVIVGGGFTGLFTALHLTHHNYSRPTILIDKQEKFCFKPLLYEYLSEEMATDQVLPRYEDLLKDSGVIFVQDTVSSIDLPQRQVKLDSGDNYSYSNLVLAVGSVTGYFGVEGAREHSFPLRSQEDAIAIKNHLDNCLYQAKETTDIERRRRLLTVVIVGAGPSGVEMAGTLADILPRWYENLGGDRQEIRIILLNHGKEILSGDINSDLRKQAEKALQKRAIPVELIMEAKATVIRPEQLEYQRNEEKQIIATATTIWTTGTSTHPLIKDLAIPDEHRDRHGGLAVTSTLQLPDYPEVFAAGDCATVEGNSLPPTAQVAYQQGKAIASNLIALVNAKELQPAEVNLRGTLLKVGIHNSIANLFNRFEVGGEIGHLIRQGTYLQLLPTPVHNFQVTQEWLSEEIFHTHIKQPQPTSRTNLLWIASIAAVLVLTCGGLLTWRQVQPVKFEHTLKPTGIPFLLNKVIPN